MCDQLTEGQEKDLEDIYRYIHEQYQKGIVFKYVFPAIPELSGNFIATFTVHRGAHRHVLQPEIVRLANRHGLQLVAHYFPLPSKKPQNWRGETDPDASMLMRVSLFVGSQNERA